MQAYVGPCLRSGGGDSAIATATITHCKTLRLTACHCRCPPPPLPLHLAPAGYYCPNTSAEIICPKGYFCPRSSLEPKKCTGLLTCPNEGESQPQVSRVHWVAGRGMCDPASQRLHQLAAAGSW